LWCLQQPRAVTSDKEIYYLGERATFDVDITLPPHRNMRCYAVFAMYPQPQPEYEVQLEQITPTHYRYVTPVSRFSNRHILRYKMGRRNQDAWYNNCGVRKELQDEHHHP